MTLGCGRTVSGSVTPASSVSWRMNVKILSTTLVQPLYCAFQLLHLRFQLADPLRGVHRCPVQIHLLRVALMIQPVLRMTMFTGPLPPRPC